MDCTRSFYSGSWEALSSWASVGGSDHREHKERGSLVIFSREMLPSACMSKKSLWEGSSQILWVFLPITTGFKTRKMQNITANSARVQQGLQEFKHKLFFHIFRGKQRMGELKTVSMQDVIAIPRQQLYHSTTPKSQIMESARVPTSRRMGKKGCTYTVRFYSVIKKNLMVPFARK